MKPSTDARNLWRILQLALIVLAGAAVYANTLQVRFVLDDDAVIGNYGPQGILAILLHGGARRVADATFALNHHLHGLQLPGYHLLNLAIHLSAAVTLYLLVSSALTALRHPFDSVGGNRQVTAFVDRFVPLAVALLFVLHPVQTQAVTYIAQRYTSLATLFYLLSAMFFIRARLACQGCRRAGYPFLLGALSLTTGILAIGSKQIAATLPVMLVMLEIFLFRGRLINRRVWIVCSAIVILAATALLIAWHGRSFNELLIALHNATSEHHGLSRSTYLLTQTRVVATYLRLLCLPFGQSLFYDYPDYTTLLSLPVMASITLHLSLLTLAALLFRRSRILLLDDRQPEGGLLRLAALGIAWFYVAMSVESSIFPITDKIFEHRIYLPSAGFFLSAASLAAYAAHGRTAGIRAAWSLLVIAAFILGSLTVARNRVWGDTFSLWQDTVNKAPGKDLALANLAGEYMKLDLPDKALPLFVRALELNPRFMTMTKVYLGMTLQRLGIDGTRFTSGEEILSPVDNPGSRELQPAEQTRLDSIMYNNLGLAYEHLGNPAKAKGAYVKALQVNPDYDLAWYNLGLLSNRQGDREQADRALVQLKRINPGLAASLAAGMKK